MKKGTKTSAAGDGKSTAKASSTLNTVQEDDENRRNDEDEELNSGFASYLKSNEGNYKMMCFYIAPRILLSSPLFNRFHFLFSILLFLLVAGIEMMKLFVIANTSLVFLTIAWPNMKDALHIFYEYIFGNH